jgi:hypothetical protein
MPWFGLSARGRLIARRVQLPPVSVPASIPEMKNAGFEGRRISLIPHLELARPERFELPAFWFVGALVDFDVLCFQQVSRPALNRNLHESALSGTECYVFATFVGAPIHAVITPLVRARSAPVQCVASAKEP